MRPFGLFERFGLELEYMVVDPKHWMIRPIVDEVLSARAGMTVSDWRDGEVEWSNELVNHVVEIKVAQPVSSLEGIERVFHERILAMRPSLEKLGATLLPGAMHPFMDPTCETSIWPHESREIYELYDRIFNCQRHGWANVQSAHLNISFQTDEEFARLHAAVRVLLPLLPALYAASPIADGHTTGFADTRLDYYRTNQERLPPLGGDIIPERVWSEAEYEQEIFEPINKAIAPLDPEHVLSKYFLNSRGAIARFDRGSIEIRLNDTQECPRADAAFARLVISVLKALVREDWSSRDTQAGWETNELKALLLATIQDARHAKIMDGRFAELFGLPHREMKAGAIWKHLIETVGTADDADVYETYLEHGTLSERMLGEVSKTPSRDELKTLCQKLNACLFENRMLIP
ncbi:hypothetical protein A3D69_01070 [Candidatus Uhrbacteria bacterium RIFCSPHIGHO2_02_FULL_54_11]|nr:MAG: hypothetical protein A3D69_01070 [Candidatus Uhrbacteria bacterium RIFCSPHIGHO2_02_FULL_54_11]